MNNKTDNVYEDTTDILLKNACSSTIDKIFDEIDTSMPNEEIVFSPGHIDAVNPIFQNERNNKNRHKVKVNLLFIAIVTVITILLSVFTAYAFRERILNILVEETRLGAIFHYKSDEEDTFEKFDINVGFIPHNFEETQKYNDINDCLIMYAHDEEYIIIDKMNAPDSYALDTEDAEIKYIDINGNEAMFIIKDDVSIITWDKNEFVFSVSGNIDKDTLVKVARNIS